MEKAIEKEDQIPDFFTLTDNVLRGVPEE